MRVSTSFCRARWCARSTHTGFVVVGTQPLLNFGQHHMGLVTQDEAFKDRPSEQAAKHRPIISAVLLTTMLPVSSAFAEGKLIVEFAGMARDAGVIVCSPVDSRAQFLSSGHPPLRDASIVITDARASWHIDGLDFGSYAICAYHDAESNSELDTDGSVFRTKITVFPTGPAALLVHLTA